MLLLLVAVIAGAVAIGAPWVAPPLVFLILIIWAGGRVASVRGRA